jgi:hypothetical protein
MEPVEMEPVVSTFSLRVREPDAGQIAEGGPAAFFLVHGDPLSDPAALWHVWRVASVDA